MFFGKIVLKCPLKCQKNFPENAHNFPKKPKNAQKCPKMPKNAQKCPKMPQMTIKMSAKCPQNARKMPATCLPLTSVVASFIKMTNLASIELPKEAKTGKCKMLSQAFW